MKRIIILLFLTVFFNDSFGQKNNQSYEIRTGLQGQFYFKNGTIANNIVNQTGGSGRSASIGGGIPINYVHHFNKFSISISPVLRYSKLIEPSFGNYNPNDKKWGFTVDTHVSIQWKLKSNKWLKNTSLGVGLSVFNIGQPFNTYYGWSHYPSPVYYEYQASSLMYMGLHAFVERQFGEKIYLKLMVLYSSGDWIKYTPFLKYSVLGNISLQYRVFKK